MLQHYELLYIIPVKFAGTEFEKIQNKVKDIIQKEGGEIDYEENLGKKKLAYAIKHNTQGFYILNEFDIETDKIKILNEKIKLTSEVLRHLIVKKKKITEEERKAAKEKEADKTDKKDGGKMAAQFDIEKQLETSSKKAEDQDDTLPAKPTIEEKKEKAEEKIETIDADKKSASVDTVGSASSDKEETKEQEKITKKDSEKIKLEDLDKKLDEIIDDSIL
jgi:small subunit ribosomal protein S6